MCPDWESNRRPFGLQANTQPIGPHQPGPCLSLLLSFMCIHTCIGMCLCIYMLLHSPSGSEAASCESASLSLSLSLSAVCFAVSRSLWVHLSLSLSAPWSYLCMSAGPSCSNRVWVHVHTGQGVSGLSSAPTSQLLRGCCFCRQGMWVNSELSPPRPFYAVPALLTNHRPCGPQPIVLLSTRVMMPRSP